jgi:anti-sigma factor RsiW
LKHERPNDESQEIASLYALGALSQFEAHSFERHLREGCAVCNAELSQFEKTVGLLSLNAAPVAPGAHLKSALAKRIKGRENATARSRSARTEACRVARCPALGCCGLPCNCVRRNLLHMAKHDRRYARASITG